MAVREYVGARYVPVFGRKGEDSIEWDDTKAYEPLTVVLHEGNSFTSRQYVPAGIDIANETYWAETGNFNAQLESVNQNITNISNKLDNLETDTNNKLSKVANGAWINLAAIGGKPDDETFDNASIINSYFSNPLNQNRGLYVPNGNWSIASTIDVSKFNVFCDGTLVPTQSFAASTGGHAFLPNNPYLINGVQFLPAIKVFEEDETNTEWFTNYKQFKYWKINIDLSNVSNLIGFYCNAVLGCDIICNVSNCNNNIGFSISPRSAENRISLNIRSTGHTPISPYGFINRCADNTYTSVVVACAKVAMLIGIGNNSYHEFHPIDCECDIAYSSEFQISGFDNISTFYADHCNTVYRVEGNFKDDYSVRIGALNIQKSSDFENPYLFNTTFSFAFNIGTLIMHGEGRDTTFRFSTLIKSLYQTLGTDSTKFRTINIEHPFDSGHVNIEKTGFPNIEYWPNCNYFIGGSNLTTIEEFKTTLNNIGIRTEVTDALKQTGDTVFMQKTMYDKYSVYKFISGSNIRQFRPTYKTTMPMGLTIITNIP